MRPRRLLLAAAAVLALATAAPAAEIRFPLRVAEARTYLEDAAGRPFLVNGDTAWSLMAELTRDEVETYLADRQGRGFNMLVVSLIERKFATDAPANRYGDEPFLAPGDFSRPNDRYFDHAEWVVRRARDLGFTLLLAPAYAGYGGGGEGWYADMERAGPAALREYGAYLGRRFGDDPNIVWLQGGDYDLPDRSLANAIVEGIRSAGGQQLQTVHSAPDTDTAAYWREEPWLAIDTVYTYGNVRAQVRERVAARQGRMPVLMLETAYENEHDSSELTLRAAAYGAVLSGAAGHVFGNNPIWHFSGPGIYAVDTTWQQELASRGAQSMTHFKALFDGLPWWTLVPADGGPVRAIDDGTVMAAADPQGRLAVAYVAAAGAVRVDAARLAAGRVAAQWYDPSSGRSVAVDPGPSGGMRTLPVPAAANDAGFRDWVLVLRAEE